MKQPELADEQVESVLAAYEQWSKEQDADAETWVYCDAPYYFALRQKLSESGANFGDIDSTKFTFVPSHGSNGEVNFLNRLFTKSDKKKNFLYIGAYD